jgi:hypothetical protein
MNVGDNEVVFRKPLAFSSTDTLRLNLGGIILAEDSVSLGGVNVNINLENEDARRLDRISIPILRARALLGTVGRVTFTNTPFGGNPQWEVILSPEESDSSKLRTVSISLSWTAIPPTVRPTPVPAPRVSPPQNIAHIMPSTSPTGMSSGSSPAASDSNLSASSFSPTGFSTPSLAENPRITFNFLV